MQLGQGKESPRTIIPKRKPPQLMRIGEAAQRNESTTKVREDLRHSPAMHKKGRSHLEGKATNPAPQRES